MIYRCNCGKSKSGSPYRASGIKPWICDRCKRDIEAGTKPRFFKSLLKAYEQNKRIRRAT